MLIFLIGFMGCGKSYTAKNLAPLLQYNLVDMDKLIEEQEQLSIAEIFEQKGEKYFRQLENNYLNSLDTKQNLLISTGGGVPCFYNNMEIMNQKGLTIYLNRSKENTIKRLIKGKHKRPLIANLNEDELSKFYDEKLAQRQPFYEQAKLFVYNADYEQIHKMIQPFTK